MGSFADAVKDQKKRRGPSCTFPAFLALLPEQISRELTDAIDSGGLEVTSARRAVFKLIDDGILDISSEDVPSYSTFLRHRRQPTQGRECTCP